MGVRVRNSAESMRDIFATLTVADYAFVVEVMASSVNFTDDAELSRRVRVFEASASPDDREALDVKLEREIRYLGSSEVAYFARYLLGREPGVSFREILRDTAHALKVRPDRDGTDREVLEDLVRQYATRTFAELPREEQQQLIEDLGVDKQKAAAFLARSAGVFAVPLMIQAFNAIVVEGLIKRVILGAIAKILGAQLARRLFMLIAGRFPWWVGWIGPGAWTLSIGWTAMDLQGPAMRKTIPVVLYLGLCCLRDREGDESQSRLESGGRAGA